MFIETSRKDISTQGNVTAALTYTIVLYELFCDSLKRFAELDKSTSLDVLIIGFHRKVDAIIYWNGMQNHIELNYLETKQNPWFRIMIHAALRV